MKEIVFIVKQLSQPRSIKRIISIQQAGFVVKVYGFDSGLYSDNMKNLPFPIEKVFKRDKSDSRLKKILFFLRSIRSIVKENKNAVFYVFAYEIAPFARFFGCKKYVYEEADVSAARIKNGFGRDVLLMVDRKTIRESLYTVFTSKGFVKYLFPQNAPENIILLPNKLSTYFDDSKREAVKKQSIDYQHIKFGFVGLIRYPNTICRFAKVVGKHFPQHEFHFFGDVERPTMLDNEIKGFSNVFFHGRFSNPVDLSTIYEAIDINIVCYDVASGNVLIAEPNKLYESIFFETPIVVSKGTFLEERVKEYGVGDAIDATKDDSIIEYIKALTSSNLNTYIEKMRSIPSSELIDNADELIASLKKLQYDD